MFISLSSVIYTGSLIKDSAIDAFQISKLLLLLVTQSKFRKYPHTDIGSWIIEIFGLNSSLLILLLVILNTINISLHANHLKAVSL